MLIKRGSGGKYECKLSKARLTGRAEMKMGEAMLLRSIGYILSASD
jgi:hypothetical protein